ncbi:unnamed protein product [Adineta steineri]|uniref:Uncharacterized protein n=1 Tax=Adineta steineri TaxID=433720 RepID=A0A818I9L3_9BILA|nr:unnamed protein product [Adineta steineri]CAF1189980.1 unnamed protein product [Adineta steineri]CAF1291954.1 unnamed protein product [Adineta steineri]CAF1293618.1 unnamed protein product [Adineta steineri]CAF1376900.1 unnamed protein product [Adineta steineri]
MLRESSTCEQEEISIEQNSISSTNDDLKELCLLLDEERFKMHQLAEQWKNFGTSAIHKLETQIVDYQEKMNDLEQRQILLVEENESLKSLVDQLSINNTESTQKKSQQNISTQTYFEKQECMIDDPLQQQISLQNMFDAIKTAEVYESIGNITGNDASEKIVLKEFCNLIWKYLEERSKPKSSCLL